MSTTVTVNSFKGLAADKRENTSSKFGFSQNFDILTHSYRLFPFTGMTANETSAYFITKFLYGDFKTGANALGSNILAYGVQSGQATTGKPELYKKDNTGNIVTSSWSTALTTTGTPVQDRGATSDVNNLFHLYQGYIYFAVGGANISRAGDLVASGTAATITNAWQTLAWQTTSQAITASNDIMYFGYTTTTATYIFSNSAGTPTTQALLLPSDLAVSCIAEYGNFLAIGCRPRSGIGKSKVFLWNKSSTSWNDVIDWGEGSIRCLANINGVLVGVSSLGFSTFNLKPTIVVKTYSGGAPQILHQLVSESSTATLYDTQWVENNILYFGASLKLNDINRLCLFAVGKDQEGNWRVTGDVNVDNDTSVTSIEGFSKFRDVWFVAHNNDGSVNRTLTDGTYTGTSAEESQVNQNMPIIDKAKKKQLVAVIVTCEALPTSGCVSLDYLVDGGAYTSIFTYTETSLNSVSFERTMTDAGVNFTSGRDYVFRLNSQGGAIITSFQYKYEVLETNA